MEEEIDLRPWLGAVLRRWRLVIGLATLMAFIAASVALVTPRPSQATVDVLIVPTSAQITLDQRFVSRDATMLTNATFQRQALLGLATSNELAQRVAAQSGATAVNPRDLEQLLGQITVRPQGDLIRITAQDETEAGALALAEAWGRGYERLVLETFSRDTLLTTLVGEQIGTAQARYQTEQTALEAFYAQGRLYEVDLQIRSLQGLLDNSIEAEKTLYLSYTQRVQELDLLLQDATTLREQLRSAPSDDISGALALLALRSRASGVTELPVQLSLAEADALGGTPATLAELDALITVLGAQRDRLATEVARVAAQISAGEPGLTGIDAATMGLYQSQLTSLRLEAEQLRAQERQLIQQRDTALASVDLLQRKLEEQRIAELTPNISVRVISSVVEPPQSRLALIVIYGGAGLLIGALAGVLTALALELASQRRRGPAPSAPAAPHPEGMVK
jgi:capsular polysaccharide biosynthesis protein